MGNYQGVGTLTRPLKILAHGYFDRGNFGDEQIRRRLADQLSAAGLSEVEWTEDRQGPARARFARLIGQALAADVVILAGGGLLKDSSLHRPMSLPLTVPDLAVAAAQGKVIIVHGIGAGPFGSLASARFAAELSFIATQFSVRDYESFARLVDAGASPERITLGTDTALLDFAAAANLLEPRAAGTCGHAGIALSGPDVYWYHQLSGAGVKSLLHTAAELALGGDEPPTRVTAYEFGAGRHSDLVAAESLQQVADRPRKTASLVDRTADEVVRELASCDVLLAGRYHAVLAAAFAGCRVVAVALDPKVHALCAELGLSVAATMGGSGPFMGAVFAGYADVGRMERLKGRATVMELRLRQALEGAAGRSKGTRSGRPFVGVGEAVVRAAARRVRTTALGPQ